MFIFLLILSIDFFMFIVNPLKNHNLVNCFCVLTADVISAVEFNYPGGLLATGDKGRQSCYLPVGTGGW